MEGGRGGGNGRRNNGDLKPHNEQEDEQSAETLGDVVLGSSPSHGACFCFVFSFFYICCCFTSKYECQRIFFCPYVHPSPQKTVTPPPAPQQQEIQVPLDPFKSQKESSDGFLWVLEKVKKLQQQCSGRSDVQKCVAVVGFCSTFYTNRVDLSLFSKPAGFFGRESAEPAGFCRENISRKRVQLFMGRLQHTAEAAAITHRLRGSLVVVCTSRADSKAPLCWEQYWGLNSN